ncbi:CFA58 [Acrasis kona]|uniref:CFA58 n=1 Tax=Acrasis kona TaxID=1008807 RepID=A0AAW2ZCW8_9EUKA
MSKDLIKDNNVEPTLNNGAFEALERDFQEVLFELAGDEHLEKFRTEFEKLHRALMRAHDNEKKLIRKCEELGTEIVSNAGKVQTALNLSKEDQNTIVKLKSEIDKVWKMVEASHKKELKAKETIQDLTKQISKLSKLVDQGAGITSGQESTVNELAKAKEDIQKETEVQKQQLQQLYQELSTHQAEIMTLNAEKKKLLDTLQVIKDDNAKQKASLSNEIREREKQERKLMDSMTSLENRTVELKNKAEVIQTREQTIGSILIQISEQEQQINKCQDTIEQHKTTIASNEKTISGLRDGSKGLNEENENLKNTLKNKELSLIQMIDEKNNWQHKHSMLTKLMKKMEEEKAQTEANRLSVKSDIALLEKKLESLKSDKEQERSNLERLKAERNYLGKKIIIADKDKDKKHSQLLVAEGRKKNIETKLKGYVKESENNKNNIYRLEKEREKYQMDASEATQKYYQALEEVKIKTLEAHDIHKKIADGAEKLKQQQALYEAVRSDRNSKGKALIEAHEETDEMKKKFKIMTQQIEQLKDEITSREKALVEVHFKMKEMESGKDRITEEIEKYKEKLHESEGINKAMEEELYTLTLIIKEADEERRKQQKDFEAFVSDRDILGTQLIRRNDEIAQLYEKLNIENSALKKGAVQYAEKVGEIKVLKKSILDLSRKLQQVVKEASKIKDLKTKLQTLERNLLEERTKSKALSEELENPMNVHRWRKLEGSDPVAYEMILKTQTLQRRLMLKSAEVQEKDLFIQEKDKLHKIVRKILERQPGPEIKQQIEAYEKEVELQDAKLSVMQEEIRAAELAEKKDNNEKRVIAEQIEFYKKKTFQYKSKDHQDLIKRTEASRYKRQQLALSHPQSQVNFTGGGFSLHQS